MSSDLTQFIGGFDLKSPRVVDDLDGVLMRLLTLRNFAADLHSVATPSPVILASAVAARDTSASKEPGEPNQSVIEDIATLVQRYRSDERSQYHQLRHKTRENYDSLIKRILQDTGDWKLAGLKREDFERLYALWKGGGKLAMAHSLVTMLRTIVSFGATVLEDSDCLRVTVVLHRMKFETTPPRSEQQKPRLTTGHVIAIREQARRVGLGSAALAQALQYDARLAQKDVIGEWVPYDEPNTISDVLNENLKWVRGIRWNQIDDNFILKHVTSAKQEEITVDLKTCPMVMEEFRHIARCKPHETLMRAKLPRVARPIIVYEETGKPYLTHKWRRNWRKLATAVGIPKEVENRDSRMIGGDDSEPADQLEKEMAQ